MSFSARSAIPLNSRKSSATVSATCQLSLFTSVSLFPETEVDVLLSRFLPYFFNCYNLVTNLVASRSTHAEMLDFAAHHDVKPLIEEFKLDEEGVADAVGRLQSGKIRYRAVLKL